MAALAGQAKMCNAEILVWASGAQTYPPSQQQLGSLGSAGAAPQLVVRRHDPTQARACISDCLHCSNALFFPLLAIVPVRAEFLAPAQGFAL
jgi:hypothetical protein